MGTIIKDGVQYSGFGGQGAVIDDTVERVDTTWSSRKIAEEVGACAKATSVYTKTQTYTKAEVDALLADIPTPDMSDYYTKSDVDRLLNGKADALNTYTVSEVNNLLANKANTSDVYTKSQTNSLLANKADAANAMRYDSINSKTEYNNNGVWTEVPSSGASEPLAQRLLGVFSNYDIYTGYLLDAKLGIAIGADTVANSITDGLPFSHILDYDSPYMLSGLTDNDLKIVPIGTKYNSTTYQTENVNLYVYKTGTYSTSGSGVVDYVAQLNKILNKVVNGNPDGDEEFFRAVQSPLYGVDYYNGSYWISNSFLQTDSYGVQYTENVDQYEMYTSAGTQYAQKVHAIGWRSDLASGKIYVKRGSSTEWIDVNISDVKTRYNNTNYDIAVNLIQNQYSVQAKHYPNYLTWNFDLSQMLTWYS